MHDLDDFTRAYIDCALWASSDESDEGGGQPMDASYDVDDIAPDVLTRMVADCRKFQADNAADIDLCCVPNLQCASDAAMAGHDFWLTRNGHGAGFCDGDWSEPGATRLDEASKAFGECTLYVGDDGLIYTF